MSAVERAAAIAAAEQLLGGRRFHQVFEKVARERLGIDSIDWTPELEQKLLEAFVDVLDERGER